MRLRTSGSKRTAGLLRNVTAAARLACVRHMTGSDWVNGYGRAFGTKLEEATMPRMHIDCREYPSEMNCTVAISADSERELIDAAVQHAGAVHGHTDSPEFRDQLSKLIKQGEMAH